MSRQATGFATLILLLISAAAGAQERPCEATARMVVEAVPKSIGDVDTMKKLLAPEIGPQLSATLNPKAAAAVFRDEELKPEARCGPLRKGDHHFECRYNGKNSALKVELERGRVTYLNRDRSEKKGMTRVADTAAVSLARKAAETIGVPMRELGPRADIRVLRVTAASGEDGAIKGEPGGSEVHVRYQRRIGDVPVAFSRYHAAIDSRGNIARMHVRWPDFRLVRGLDAANALPREAVVGRVLGDIDRDNRCGSLSGVTAKVVYARTAVVEGGEGLTEDGAEKETPSSEFVPALLVTVIPVEQKEDSGVVQMPVQNYVFPLFHGADRPNKPN